MSLLGSLRKKLIKVSNYVLLNGETKLSIPSLIEGSNQTHGGVIEPTRFFQTIAENIHTKEPFPQNNSSPTPKARELYHLAFPKYKNVKTHFGIQVPELTLPKDGNRVIASSSIDIPRGTTGHFGVDSGGAYRRYPHLYFDPEGPSRDMTIAVPLGGRYARYKIEIDPTMGRSEANAAKYLSHIGNSTVAWAKWLTKDVLKNINYDDIPGHERIQHLKNQLYEKWKTLNWDEVASDSIANKMYKKI